MYIYILSFDYEICRLYTFKNHSKITLHSSHHSLIPNSYTWTKTTYIIY